MVNYTITEKEIALALKHVVTNISPLIKPTQSLLKTVYLILKKRFIDNYRFVILEAPTGSGKTIIGLIFNFTYSFIVKLKEEGLNIEEIDLSEYNLLTYDINGYYLTSNKVLQEQITNDINRFNLKSVMSIIKGVENYECIPATKDFKDLYKNPNKLRERILKKNPDAKFASYTYRKCVNYSGEKLRKKFPECIDICPYKCARVVASYINLAVLNYAYWLNVMRVPKNPEVKKYFGTRNVTICDEAHLLPDIVCNLFNLELTDNILVKINNKLDDIEKVFSFNQKSLEVKEHLKKCFKFFKFPINNFSEVITYCEDMLELGELLTEMMKEYNSVSKESFRNMYGDIFDDLFDDIASYEDYLDNMTKLSERPEDIYFESEKNSNFDIQKYKHIIKDLNESRTVRKNCIDKIDFGLFMSGTLGNMDEFAKLLGLEENEYTKMFLPSTFDFTKSPIYLTDSGYLNYNSFDSNIDRILDVCIRITKLHENEKGLIHTATFKINNMLKERLMNDRGVDFSRFLFYNTTAEKENLLSIMKQSNIPYILVGPSLYEGIDLPDDQCRFQIMIKVPYAQINSYVKKKMERYPFWYKRNCIEKIIQAIGRSNRHKNDYSKIYLLDSLFDKIIYETNDEIIGRLEYKKMR